MLLLNYNKITILCLQNMTLTQDIYISSDAYSIRFVITTIATEIKYSVPLKGIKLENRKINITCSLLSIDGNY